MVLSGGLDSSIVAQLGKGDLGLTAAVTVLATPGAADRPQAAAVAAAAGLKHHCVETTLPELLEGELRTCVEALHCFDPLRRCIAPQQHGGMPGAAGGCRAGLHVCCHGGRDGRAVR